MAHTQRFRRVDGPILKGRLVAKNKGESIFNFDIGLKSKSFRSQSLNDEFLNTLLNYSGLFNPDPESISIDMDSSIRKAVFGSINDAYFTDPDGTPMNPIEALKSRKYGVRTEGWNIGESGTTTFDCNLGLSRFGPGKFQNGKSDVWKINMTATNFGAGCGYGRYTHAGIDLNLGGGNSDAGLPVYMLFDGNLTYRSRYSNTTKLQQNKLPIGEYGEYVLYTLPGYFLWNADGKDEKRYTIGIGYAHLGCDPSDNQSMASGSYKAGEKIGVLAPGIGQPADAGGCALRGCLKPVSPTLYVPHHPQAHNLRSSIQLLAA